MTAGASTHERNGGHQLIDTAAEASVLGALVLAEPWAVAALLSANDGEPLQAFTFTEHLNVTFWRAIADLHEERLPLGTQAIASRAHQINPQADPGAIDAALASLAERAATSEVSLGEARDRLVELANRRRLRLTCQAVQQGIEHGRLSSAEALEQIAGAGVAAPRPAPSPFRNWIRFATGQLSQVPKSRRWLFRHPTLDGHAAPPRQGDGAVPLGKPCALTAAGGAGKTMTVVQMSTAVATGRQLFDYFHVGDAAIGRRVALVLAEEDFEEVHRRFFNVARALGLDDDERRQVEQKVVLLPLAGQPCSLLKLDAAGAVIQSGADVAALQATLAETAGSEGFALIVLDPLARLSQGLAESVDGAGTLLVQIAEQLTEAPGGPAVLTTHHSSKMARTAGQVDSRGRTELTDAMRHVISLREDGDRIILEQPKSNYSRPWAAPVILRRGPEGALVALSGAEQESRAAAFNQAAVQREVDAVVAALRALGGVATKSAIAKQSGMRKTDALAAVAVAIAKGAITTTGTEARPVCHLPIVGEEPPRAAHTPRIPREPGTGVPGPGGREPVTVPGTNGNQWELGNRTAEAAQAGAAS